MRKVLLLRNLENNILKIMLHYKTNLMNYNKKKPPALARLCLIRKYILSDIIKTKVQNTLFMIYRYSLNNKYMYL